MEDAWPARTFGSGRAILRSIVLVVVVALVIGAATALGQQYLPDAIRSLANAAGPWFFAILIAVRIGHRPLILSILLAIVGFALLNGAYGLVTVLRGYPYPLVNIWTVVAIPAGIVVGCAATWLDSPRRPLAALAILAPALVLVAEGVYGLTVVLATTGPVVWILEFAGAVAWVVWALARTRTSARSPAARPS
ncbi:MAG TPA: DUF6518 family protein [Galbitalea sp.]